MIATTAVCVSGTPARQTASRNGGTTAFVMMPATWSSVRVTVYKKTTNLNSSEIW